MSIAIIDYGMGNIQSIINCFHSLNTNVAVINEPSKLTENLYEYLSSFSPNVQDIVQNFGLQKHIDKLVCDVARVVLKLHHTWVKKEVSLKDSFTID